MSKVQALSVLKDLVSQLRHYNGIYQALQRNTFCITFTPNSPAQACDGRYFFRNWNNQTSDKDFNIMNSIFRCDFINGQSTKTQALYEINVA